MVDVTRSHNTIKKEGYILYISLSEKGMVEIFPRALIERHVSTKMRHFFKSVVNCAFANIWSMSLMINLNVLYLCYCCGAYLFTIGFICFTP
jgi:hypothetical protein